MLEELLAAEELKIRVLNPTVAQHLIGHVVLLLGNAAFEGLELAAGQLYAFNASPNKIVVIALPVGGK